MEWNKTLQVSGDEDGRTGFLSLLVDDILYFRAEGVNITAHTADSTYYYGYNGGSAVKRLLDALRVGGYQFYRSDRVDIPNISKIKRFSKTWSRAYFSEDDSLFVYIAKHRFDDFVALTRQHNKNIP